MKIEIQIDKTLEEPVLLMKIPKLTEKLIEIIESLENIDEDKAIFLTAKKEDSTFIIEPEKIEIMRTEGSIIKVYDRSGKDFDTNKTLNELLELSSNFIRISKSTIVNINRVDHIQPYFNGTMYIVMKNGINDYISRKYLGDFKKILGL
ncbi:MAG: LytTR family transcriptional regulator [Defluviitaleaceae bacterium]|nr:LytTR family transcriptional regulator [Defluviitaleaceae bacterium]